MSKSKLTQKEVRHLALQIEIVTAHLCQMCADLNNAAADDAVDHLTQAQAEVLKLSEEPKKKDALTFRCATASQADYEWIAQEFYKTWQ